MQVCNLDHIKVWEIKYGKFQGLGVNPRFLKIIALSKEMKIAFSKFLGNAKRNKSLLSQFRKKPHPSTIKEGLIRS